MPVAWVISKGRLQWKGNPAELPTVIQRLQSGHFSRSSQQQISYALRDLQKAVQSGLPDVIMNAANRILAIQDGDLTAVQAKLFVYNNSGKTKEALLFLQEQIKRCPDLTQLKFFALDAAVRAGDKKAWQQILLDACQNVTQKYRAGARIFFYAVSNAPHGWLPYPQIRQIADELQKALPADYPQAFKASVMEFSARVSYLGADVEQAEKLQKAACELRQNTPYEKQAEELLQYYQIISASRRNKL